MYVHVHNKTIRQFCTYNYTSILIELTFLVHLLVLVTECSQNIFFSVLIYFVY